MVSARALVKDLWGRHRTKLQREVLWREKYAGRRVSWLVEVSEIQNGLEANLHWPACVREATDHLLIFAYLSPSPLHDLAHFSKGSRAVVAGTLESYAESDSAGMHFIDIFDASLRHASITQRLGCFKTLLLLGALIGGVVVLLRFWDARTPTDLASPHPLPPVSVERGVEVEQKRAHFEKTASAAPTLRFEALEVGQTGELPGGVKAKLVVVLDTNSMLIEFSWHSEALQTLRYQHCVVRGFSTVGRAQNEPVTLPGLLKVTNAGNATKGITPIIERIGEDKRQ